jgi:hypothetical protein
MKSRTVGRVKLPGDNREVRVTKIQTGRDDLVRVGIYLTPEETALSGAVFPESSLDDVIRVLEKARTGGR